MAIELSDDDLAAIRARTFERLNASSAEYTRLLQTVRGKLQENPKAEPEVALCCAWYQNAISQCNRCIALLDGRCATAETISDLIRFTSVAWESLGALILVLHGGSPPLAQTFLDEQLSANRSKSASHAARAKLDQPGGYTEKRDKVRAAWASGRYSSRDECARKKHVALGISLSTARRALKGTPDPSRS